MKYVYDSFGDKLTKFDMAYQLLKYGGNFDRYIVYYTLVDKFSYAELVHEYIQCFKIDNNEKRSK